MFNTQTLSKEGMTAAWYIGKNVKMVLVQFEVTFQCVKKDTEKNHKT